MEKELTFEEKKERVKNFRPIDDVFFEVLAENKDVCEEMLQIILEDPSLTVKDVIVQSSERNIYGRSVRLDALCVLGDGTKCNIEVQRSDSDNHLKRARYNASSITIKESNPGDRFDDIVTVYIVYISEFDFLKKGKTIYHIDKIIRETGETIDDGLHEVFVNTTIDDNTKIAELMSCFLKKEINNKNFPQLSKEVYRLKNTEGGLTTVCELMNKYIDEEKFELIKNMIKENLPVSQIARIAKITEDKVNEIKSSMLQTSK